jgi:polyhydroxybutyrate depolymerase
MKSTCISMALTICGFCSAAYGQGQVLNRTLQHDGLTRRYALYVPSAYTGNAAWPLVINMHGATSNSSQQMSFSGMNAVADAGDFLVVYPDALGSPTFWNDGISPSSTDDVGFISQLLDELESGYSIDSSRVYATGLSNGGTMSYILGRDLRDRIAAVASVAGSIDLTTGRPIPALHVHGTADPVGLFNGGPIPQIPSIVLPPVMQVIDNWRESNGCTGEPTITQLPNLNAQDSSTVELVHYENCECYLTSSGEERPAEVLFYRIDGGGHTWPGGAAAPAILGPVNRDINASQEIWNFFSRHELPATMPASLPGDYNQNGTVEQADLDLALLHWGSPFDGLPDTWVAQRPTEGSVDQSELDAVLLNWGQMAGGLGSAASVPEPATIKCTFIIVATLGVLCPIARQRRRM